MKAFFNSILYISVLQRLGKERNILLPKLLFPPEDTEPPPLRPKVTRTQGRERGEPIRPFVLFACVQLLSIGWRRPSHPETHPTTLSKEAR